jgi:hypothetical protein
VARAGGMAAEAAEVGLEVVVMAAAETAVAEMAAD